MSDIPIAQTFSSAPYADRLSFPTDSISNPFPNATFGCFSPADTIAQPRADSDDRTHSLKPAQITSKQFRALDGRPYTRMRLSLLGLGFRCAFNTLLIRGSK